MSPQKPSTAAQWAAQLNLSGVRARGPKEPLFLGREFAQGTPRIVTLDEYLQATLPGEAGTGDYVKEAASSAFGQFVDAYGNVGQNLLEMALPESVEKAWGINNLAANARLGAAATVTPSADVEAHGGGIGKFLSRDVGGALGTMAAYAVPGLFAGKIAAALGGSAAAARTAAMAGTGAIGALHQSESLYNDILKETGSESKAWMAYFAGLGLGATEVADIPVLMGADKKTRGFLKDILVHGALEGAQEGVQQAGEEGVYAALTDQERNSLANIFQAMLAGGAVGAGSRGVGRFAQGFLDLHRGTSQDIVDDLKTPGISHEDRLKLGYAPWESLQPTVKSVVDDFLSEAESDALSESQKDDIRRTIVVAPETPVEKFIADHMAKRGAKPVFISHPGGPLSRPSAFDANTGVTIFDTQAAPQAMLYSFWAHETGHLDAETNPQAFAELMSDLEQKAPDLVEKARERRFQAEPGADWMADQGLVKGETYGQLSQDLAGILYLMQEHPEYIAKAIKGPGKLSIVRLLDSAIGVINKTLGTGFNTYAGRQIEAVQEINRLITGTNINAKDAIPIAKIIHDRWGDLIGQTYSYSGGVAEGNPPKPATPEQQGPVAPRGASYERAREAGTMGPGQAPNKEPFRPMEESPEFEQDFGTAATAPAAGVPPTGGLLEGMEAPEGEVPQAPAQAPVQPGAPAPVSPFGGEQNPAGIQVAPGGEHSWMVRMLQAQGAAAKQAVPVVEKPVAKKAPVEGEVAPVEPKPPPEQKVAIPEQKASSLPNVEEGEGILTEAEETPQQEQDREEREELERLRTLGHAGELDPAGKRRALELYAKTDDGRANLMELAQGGLTKEDVSDLSKSIKADVGFNVTRTPAAAALHKAEVRTPSKPTAPSVSLDVGHPDYPAVNKLTHTFFKDPRLQSALMVWQTLKSQPKSVQMKQVREILSTATGTPNISDAVIQRAIEEIAENRARGVQGPERKTSSRFRNAALNPYTKGDNLLAPSSEEASATRDFFNRTNEFLFDDFEAMRRAVKGRKLGEDTDVSMKHDVYWGRVGNLQTWIRKNVQKPVMETLAKAGVDVFQDSATRPSFDSYLLARSHEKYKAVVDARRAAEPTSAESEARGTITPEERAKIMEEASLLPEGDRRGFLERAYERRKQQVSLAKGSGITDQEAKEILNKVEQQPNNVKRAYKESAELVYQMTKEGRQWLVSQGNITAQESEAWDKLFGKEYVPHLSIYEPDMQFTPIGDGFQAPAKLFERVKGRTSRPYSPTVAVFSQAMQRAIVSERNRVGRSLGDLVNSVPDESVWKSFNSHGEIPPELVDTGKVFRYLDNGQKRWVGFTGKEGARLAKAMRRLNIHNAGVLEKVRPLTRMVMNMATSWNVFFSLGNISRDVLTAMANSGVEVDKKFAKSVAMGAPSSLKTALRAAGFEGLVGKASPGEIEDFRAFEAAGGRTGIVELQTYGNRMRRIAAEFKRFSGSKNPLHIRRNLQNTIEILEDFNGAFEQATRYSAWKEAKQRGATNDAAARMAKEISVNFNKRGTIAPVLGSLYAFSSANLAGLHRFGRAVGTKRGIALAGGLAALGFFESLFNRSNSGEDEDGENAWNALNDYEKARNFRISTGGSDFYGFPLPWGWNLPVYIGVLAEHAMFGKGMKPAEFARKVLTETVENLNPVGGQTIAQAVTPTVGRFATEIGQNIDPFGRPIRPEPVPFDYATPNYEQHFSSVSPVWKEVARQLAMIGGDEVKPGPIDISPEDMEHTASFMAGGSLRNIQRFVSVMADVLGGDTGRLSSLPGARYFSSSPSPESRAMRFHQAVRGAEESKQLLDRAMETGNPDLIVKTAEEEGPGASTANTMQDLQKAYSTLRKALQASVDDGEKKEIQDAMDEIQRLARTIKEGVNR